MLVYPTFSQHLAPWQFSPLTPFLLSSYPQIHREPAAACVQPEAAGRAMQPPPRRALAALLALATLLPSSGADENQRLPCGLARMKCLYRDGCRKALDNYMDGCLDIMNGHAKTCNDFCTKSLIALTSTLPGHALMEVRTGKGRREVEGRGERG